MFYKKRIIALENEIKTLKNTLCPAKAKHDYELQSQVETEEGSGVFQCVSLCKDCGHVKNHTKMYCETTIETSADVKETVLKFGELIKLLFIALWKNLLTKFKNDKKKNKDDKNNV